MERAREHPETRLGPLARTGWLSEEPAEFRARIAAAGRWTRLERGTELYAVGDEPDGLFGLAEGLLDISLPIGGDEEVVIHRAGPGFWVGDSAILAESTRTISVRTAAESLVFRVPVAAVRRLLSDHPADASAFARLAHRNGTLALQVLAETIALSPRARFARMLLRLAADDGSVRVTQEELGRMAGMSRAAFRRAFAALIDAGAVRTEYGAVRILDRARLEREADEI